MVDRMAEDVKITLEVINMKSIKILFVILIIFAFSMSMLAIITNDMIYRALFGISGIACLVIQALFFEDNQNNKGLLLIICLLLLQQLL